MESKYLIFVDAVENHNKFYEATHNDDGSIDVTYGRVGAPKVATHHYRSGERNFYDLIDSKLRKGYVERTALHVTKKTGADRVNKPIEDKEIKAFVDSIIAKAREFVSKNYTVSHDAITDKMIQEAQEDINYLNDLVNANCSLYEFNNALLEVFKDVPRRMPHVVDFLAKTSKDFASIIDREQDMIDNLRGQIVVLKGDNAKGETILEENGISITDVSYDEEDYLIHKLSKKNSLGESNENRFMRAYRVRNEATEARYLAYCNANNLEKNKGTHKYFHGTKIENLWSIFRTGLILNPKASVTGKAFGQGIYFAEHSQKSLGYTSLRGSYWARGGEQTGILLVYDVAVGKSYITNSILRSSFREQDLKKLGDYHSVYTSSVFRNSETVVYNQDQCTIRYAIEISGYHRDYTLSLDERKNLRFQKALGELEKKGDVYQTRIHSTDLSEKARTVMDKITDGSPITYLTITYRPDTKEIDILNKKGLSILSDSLTGNDKAWIARQMKREFADNDKAFDKYISTIKEKETLER